MDSLRALYRIGHGPSSSHTMAPRRAAEIFENRFPQARFFSVTLYGSLAATGRGHLTDQAIIDAFGEIPTQIQWRPREVLPLYANGMEFQAFGAQGNSEGVWRVYSVGGGALADEKGPLEEMAAAYPWRAMEEILRWTRDTGKTIWEYVEEAEGDTIWPYLETVWEVMKRAIARGLETEGVLPGTLALPRKASSYFAKANNTGDVLGRLDLLFAYALATAEENASGGEIVTAPTCGSAGVLPAVLTLLQRSSQLPESKFLRALATAGCVGNLVKENASISGAEVGCQGEVGTACSMAAAAAAYLWGGTPSQIEYAAEMGLEHHLGLTCDPVAGLVQIPCIERNAMAAGQAVQCAAYALLSDGRHRVSFDQVVETMEQTGHDLQCGYRETARGGLAKSWIAFRQVLPAPGIDRLGVPGASHDGNEEL